MAICSDGRSIWVANRNDDNVTKLDADSGTVIGTYAVSHNPIGICSDGGNIWITNQGSNTVTKLNGSNGVVLEHSLLELLPMRSVLEGVVSGSPIWSLTISVRCKISSFITISYLLGNFDKFN